MCFRQLRNRVTPNARRDMDWRIILARILAVVVIFVLLRPPEEASQTRLTIPINPTKRR